MGTHKSAITAKNVNSWLAATGFIFPTTEAELDRLEKLHKDVEIPKEQRLDPDVIMGKKEKVTRTVVKIDADINTPIMPSLFAMAARNGKCSISQHILDRMKNKHQNPNDGSD